MSPTLRVSLATGLGSGMVGAGVASIGRFDSTWTLWLGTVLLGIGYARLATVFVVAR